RGRPREGLRHQWKSGRRGVCLRHHDARAVPCDRTAREPARVGRGEPARRAWDLQRRALREGGAGYRDVDGDHGGGRGDRPIHRLLGGPTMCARGRGSSFGSTGSGRSRTWFFAAAVLLGTLAACTSQSGSKGPTAPTAGQSGSPDGKVTVTLGGRS